MDDDSVEDTPDDSSDLIPGDSPEWDPGDQDEPQQGAPRYSIPARTLSAVEIPAVVQDVDRAVRAFGRVPSLKHTLDQGRNSIPLYLNPESPYCKPIMSHNARTHNVVLKVTVPRRTGRKRKRGSDDPWQGDIEVRDASESLPAAEQVFSRSRLDDPKVLRRKLEDNVENYSVEAVGTIKNTHRFRGLADFYWDMSKSPFARRYVEQVLPGDVQKMKQFSFTPGIDSGPNVDVIPPPLFTHTNLPFNYFYSQNPYVRTTADGGTVNTTAVKQIGYFISANDPAPEGPQMQPDMTDPRLVEVIARLEEAFEDRPVWTRRSLLNHMGEKLRNWNELKKYLNYVAYQFKGGPWRDGVVPYGVDPRTDPKYRVYQTLMFKLPPQRRTSQNETWHSLRRARDDSAKNDAADSHIFDGETYHTDGKVWQVCDITDPVLKDLLDGARVRPSCNSSSGWYHGGLWAKVKAIMKTKLVAIQFGRRLTPADFAPTLAAGNQSPTRAGPATFQLPLPSLHLTDAELTTLRGREPGKKSRKKGYSVLVRGRAGSFSPVAESSATAEHHQAEGSLLGGLEEANSENHDSGSEGRGEDEEDDYPDQPLFKDEEDDDGSGLSGMDEDGDSGND